MTKEQPVNSDPMYPRNRGYQFGGYQLDKDGVPTFLYRTGAVTIEDTTHVVVYNRPDRPRPHAAAECAEGGAVYFRVLTGKVQKLVPGQYGTDSLKVQRAGSQCTAPGAGRGQGIVTKTKPAQGANQNWCDSL